MRWTVRAIDKVAAFAAAGAVVVGATYAVHTWAAWPSGPSPDAAPAAAPTPGPSPTSTPVPASAPTGSFPTGSPPASQQGRPQPPARTSPHTAPRQTPAGKAGGGASRGPLPWLVDSELAALLSKAEAEAATGSQVTVATFNVLGSSHTAPRGERPSWPSGASRIVQAAAALRDHDVDLVGLQELQPDQVAGISRALSDYALFPGASMTWREGENSIMWRRDTWTAVEARTVAIPYFDGEVRRMPYVRLRHRLTGEELWMANFHNPADTGRFGRQDRWRAAATAREVALARELAATGVPVLFTGDFNDRSRYFCALTGATDLRSSTGGSATPTSCSPPQRPQVDWVFGSSAITWLSSTVDTGPLSRRVTDHPLVVATGVLPAP